MGSSVPAKCLRAAARVARHDRRVHIAVHEVGNHLDFARDPKSASVLSLRYCEMLVTPSLS